MKRKNDPVDLGDVGNQPLKSDFEALKRAQARQWEREKASGQKASDAWDHAEFLSLDEFRERLKPARKEAVSIRFDADVLAWVKSAGKGYQTMLNALLRQLKDGKLELVEASGNGAKTAAPWPPLPRKRAKRTPA